MINQKPISVRLDLDRLIEINQEKFTAGVSTNRIINEGATAYCRIMDARRRYRYYGRERECNDMMKQLNLLCYMLPG